VNAGVEEANLEGSLAGGACLANDQHDGAHGRRAAIDQGAAALGRPLRTNGRSARANTNGSTGRMQELTIVRAPPR